MTASVEQVYLLVRDLEESTAFYADVLGLRVATRGERTVSFETGGCQLKLEADFEPEALAEFGLEPPGPRRGEGAFIVIEVDSIDDVHERSIDAAADVLHSPRKVPWGREMFLLRDPDGYVIEVSRPIDPAE